MTIEGTSVEIMPCDDLPAGRAESSEEREPTRSQATWDQEADALAHLLSPLWPEVVSAEEAVSEQRR